MRELFYRLKSNAFFKNVAILASGTIISQMIVIATSPLLSRLYSVESFGILSLFTSYITIAAVISTGRYELAIAIPSLEKDAKKLIHLILYIASGVSLFYLGVIFILKQFQLTNGNDLLVYNWIYIAPFYIFAIAVNSAVMYWYQRKKEYRKVTIISSVQVIITTLLSIVLGYFFHLHSGLVIGLVAASVIVGFYVLIDFWKTTYSFSNAEVKKIAKDYISFPKYMIVSDLSLAGSQQLTPIIFSVLFNTTIVGFYSMANRMIRLPNIVVTSAIGNVFRNEAIEEIRIKGNCRSLYISTLKKLFFLSVPIYLLIFIFSPIIFSYVFGKVWYTAGEYARVLSVMLFFEFISSPLSIIFQLLQKQKTLLALQVFNTILGGVGIYLGYYIYHNAIWSLIFFTISSMLFSIFSLYLSFKYSLNGFKK